MGNLSILQELNEKQWKLFFNDAVQVLRSHVEDIERHHASAKLDREDFDKQMAALDLLSTPQIFPYEQARRDAADPTGKLMRLVYDAISSRTHFGSCYVACETFDEEIINTVVNLYEKAGYQVFRHGRSMQIVWKDISVI